MTDRTHTFCAEVDLSRAPIEIGADLAGAILPMVHDLAGAIGGRGDPADVFNMLHGFSAALFGAIFSMVGIESARSILAALHEYGERIKADEAGQAAPASGFH